MDVKTLQERLDNKATNEAAKMTKKALETLPTYLKLKNVTVIIEGKPKVTTIDDYDWRPALHAALMEFFHKECLKEATDKLLNACDSIDEIRNEVK